MALGTFFPRQPRGEAHPLERVGHKYNRIHGISQLGEARFDRVAKRVADGIRSTSVLDCKNEGEWLHQNGEIQKPRQDNVGSLAWRNVIKELQRDLSLKSWMPGWAMR